MRPSARQISAAPIILVHNHPGGDPSPSAADIQMTQATVDATRPARHRDARPHHRRQDGHASLREQRLI